MISIALIIATLCSSQTHTKVGNSYYNACYTDLNECINNKSKARYEKEKTKPLPPGVTNAILFYGPTPDEQDLMECLK